MSPKRKHLYKFLNAAIVAVTMLVGAFTAPAMAYDDSLIMVPVLQGYPQEEFAIVYTDDGKTFLPLVSMTHIAGMIISRNENGIIAGHMGNNPGRGFRIDANAHSATFDDRTVKFAASDVQEMDGLISFPLSFYEKLFNMTFELDDLNMEMKVEAPEKLPNTIKAEALKNRGKIKQINTQKEKWADYIHDQRWWTFPVVDFNYTESLFSQRIFHDVEHNTSEYGTWSVNVANLMMGLDSNLYMYGGKNADTQIRWKGSRVFLEDDPNWLNLTTFAVGDISGFGSSYFVANSYGRGVTASSFRNYVVSADKTITLSDSLADGWEVELYLNGQLIGFRQHGAVGRYEFADIPVIYGLNEFKLVFYGPYGEIREETKRYYSGTSPVRVGEFGYVVNAYQQGRYLVEDGNTIGNDSDVPTIDTVLYYGVNDYITAIAGLTTTQDAKDPNLARNFGMVGGQFLLWGSSWQYNLLADLDTMDIGHHVEVSGDIYIGNIFARYDTYGNMESPLSARYGAYLDNLAELRLTGVIPGISTPYYISLSRAESTNGIRNDQVSGRLSKQLLTYINVSIEDTWQSNTWYDSGQHSATNYVNLLAQANWHNFGVYTSLGRQTYPYNIWTNFQMKLDYRWDRYTYFAAQYQHNFNNSSVIGGGGFVSSLFDSDVFSVSASRLFDFGGLSLDASLSTIGNLRLMARYNISFGKVPGRFAIFTDARSKLSDNSAALVRAVDEHGAPLSDIIVSVNGTTHAVRTDEYGEAVVTDIASYEKTLISTDIVETGDISLSSDNVTGRYVMRPGTVRDLSLRFAHKGVLEGALESNKRAGSLYGYEVYAYDTDGILIESALTDRDGLFILENLTFGAYRLNISFEGNDIAIFDGVVVDDVVSYFTGNVDSSQMITELNITPSKPVTRPAPPPLLIIAEDDIADAPDYAPDEPTEPTDEFADDAAAPVMDADEYADPSADAAEVTDAADDPDMTDNDIEPAEIGGVVPFPDAGRKPGFWEVTRGILRGGRIIARHNGILPMM